MMEVMSPVKPHRIDVHYHILPRRRLAVPQIREDFMRALAPLMGATEGRSLIESWSPARAVEALDRNGIAAGICSCDLPGGWFGDIPTGRRLTREWNEEAAELGCDYRGRFGLFASLPLPDPDGALAEIEYAFEVLGADGVGLLTSYGDKWLGDSAFTPVLAELDRRGAVVFVHPTAPACCRGLMPGVPTFFAEVPMDTARAIINLVFSGTLLRFPRIRFIFSHGGGTIAPLAGRIAGFARRSRDFADRAPDGFEAELAKLYYDTANAAHPALIAALLQLAPTTHILFGSDAPFIPAAETIANLHRLRLSRDAVEAIEHGNARALLPRWRN